jgi:hypothetical protein
MEREMHRHSVPCARNIGHQSLAGSLDLWLSSASMTNSPISCSRSLRKRGESHSSKVGPESQVYDSMDRSCLDRIVRWSCVQLLSSLAATVLVNFVAFISTPNNCKQNSKGNRTKTTYACNTSKASSEPIRNTNGAKTAEGPDQSVAGDRKRKRGEFFLFCRSLHVVLVVEPKSFLFLLLQVRRCHGQE